MKHAPHPAFDRQLLTHPPRPKGGASLLQATRATQALYRQDRQSDVERLQARPSGDARDIMISVFVPAELMAQFIVRHLEDDIKARLKRRAERHGRSMEEEARQILRNAVREENQPAPRLGSRIAKRFRKAGLTKDLPELRGQPVRAIDFGS